MAWNEIRKKLSIGSIGLWIIVGVTTIVMIALILGDVFSTDDIWIPIIPIGTLLILATATTIVDIRSESKIKMGIVGIWTIFGLTLIVFSALMVGRVFQPSEYWIPMIPIGSILFLSIIPTILEYTAGDVRFCPKCGVRFNKKWDFCQECGTRILINCPSCGTKIKGNPKYCFKCGINLSETEIIQTPSTRLKFKTEGYTKLCKQCEAPASDEAKYCVLCGASQ